MSNKNWAPDTLGKEFSKLKFPQRCCFQFVSGPGYVPNAG